MLATHSRFVCKYKPEQKRGGKLTSCLYPMPPKENFLKKRKGKVLFFRLRVLICSVRITQIFGLCLHRGTDCASTAFHNLVSATKGRATFCTMVILRDELRVQKPQNFVPG